MLQILQNLRERIIQKISAAESLTADLLTGSNIVTIGNATKWDTGYDVVVRNDDIGEGFKVQRVIDKNTIELDHTATHDWLVSDRAQLNNAVGYHYLKLVLLGDHDIIANYPAITLEANTKSIEWMTIPGTSDEFTITISTYVLEDNSEESYELLLKYTSAIEEMLMQNLHPDLDVITQTPLANSSIGDTLISVPDATVWNIPDLVVFESIEHRDMVEVKSIIIDPDPMKFPNGVIELTRGLHFDFTLADRYVVKKLRRYIYDSRVTSITYGYVQKGSAFLKASQISWYAKEERTRLQECQPLQHPPFLP